MKKQTWTWISAVAAMLAASGLSVRAQDAPAPPAPPASGMDTGTDSPSMRQSPPMDRPQYSLLLDRDFDYQDLKQAAAVGLSDNTIARIFLIARMTGVPFRHIRDEVERGVTFYKLVDEYSLDGSLLADVSEEKMEIAAYESAYESSALNGRKTSASAQDSELQASFARFKQLNDNFPATATPSTLVFERGPAPAQTAEVVTTETAVRQAPRPVETVEETHTTTVKPVVYKAPVKHVAAVKHTRVHRHRTMRMHRKHQVHHHMPVYMHHGS